MIHITDNNGQSTLGIVIHPERSPKSKLHDIAILILEKVPPYTDFIRPICLPEQTLSLVDINNKKGVLYVTGWGWTIGSFQSPSNVKRHTPVNHVNTSICRNYYRNINEVSVHALRQTKIQVDE